LAREERTFRSEDIAFQFNGTLRVTRNLGILLTLQATSAVTESLCIC
jgi:hypothetical protein